MKRTVLTAAIITAFAAPAVAQDQSDALTTGVEIHNQSVDSAADTITSVNRGTTVKIGENSALATAVELINQSADSPSDRISLDSLTVFPSEPAYASDVIDRIRAED